MSEQRYQSEVMDELRQITEGFFKTADAFVERQKQASRDTLPDPFLSGTQPPVSAAFTKE